MTRRANIAIWLLAIAALVLSGCSSSESTSTDTSTSAVAGLPVTVDSLTGGTVKVTDVSKIVPLNGDVAEIVFALGLGDKVAAVDISATFPEAANLPKIGYQRTLNAEGVIALAPTVVLGTEEAGPPAAVEQIAAAGIPTVKIPRGETVDDVPGRIEAVAKALGVDGSELANKTREQIDAAKSRAAKENTKPRVAFLYLRGQNGVYQIGGAGSRADAMITAAGGVDAGTEAGIQGFQPMTAEALVAANPDVILVLTAGLESVGGVDGLLSQPGVAQTKAGAERKIVAIDDLLLLGLGPRTGEALDQLITGIHGN